jgi:N-acetylmuramoyl-L-alanine amidase
VFIVLEKRPQIANKAKANLFLSIHADWAKSSTVHGASTFTLGQNRTQENFEIAKRENSVILLEDDYKQRYEGFDPNSAESYIMFEFMQDNYMNQSIEFASIVQKWFKSSGRYDRAVRQDVFLVLKNTSMPSALVELGFISNKEEELFLKSDQGRDQLAGCLYKAFIEFKNAYERKSGVKKEILTVENQKNDSDVAVQIKQILNQNDDSIVFKVQLLLTPKPIPVGDRRLKGIEMDYYIDNGNYKYTYGSWLNFNDADKKRREFTTMFPDAFVVAFRNGQRIPLNEARKSVSK